MPCCMRAQGLQRAFSPQKKLTFGQLFLEVPSGIQNLYLIIFHSDIYLYYIDYILYLILVT